MDRYSVLFILKSTRNNILVQFIDQVVNFGLQRLYTLQILVAELVCGAFDKILHIIDIAEICSSNNALIRLGRCVVLSGDFNC